MIAYFYAVALGAIAVLAFLFGGAREYRRGVRDATNYAGEKAWDSHKKYTKVIDDLQRTHDEEVRQIHRQYQDEIDAIEKRHAEALAHLKSTVVVTVDPSVDLGDIGDGQLSSPVIEGQVPHLTPKIGASWRCPCGAHPFYEPACNTCSRTRPFRAT